MLAAEASEPVPLLIAFVMGPLLMGAGILIGIVGYRGVKGTLERNQALGIRTPFTMSSDEVWTEVHRAAGPWFFGAGAASFVPGAIVLFRPSNETGTLVILVGMGLMVSLVAVASIIGTASAKRL